MRADRPRKRFNEHTRMSARPFVVMRTRDMPRVQILRRVDRTIAIVDLTWFGMIARLLLLVVPVTGRRSNRAQLDAPAKQASVVQRASTTLPVRAKLRVIGLSSTRLPARNRAAPDCVSMVRPVAHGYDPQPYADRSRNDEAENRIFGLQARPDPPLVILDSRWPSSSHHERQARGRRDDDHSADRNRLSQSLVLRRWGRKVSAISTPNALQRSALQP